MQDRIRLIVAVFVCLIISIVLLVGLNRNSKVLLKQDFTIVSRFLPQGWAFFTKSPRDVETKVYDALTKEQLVYPNFSYLNNFGLTREPTRMNLEVGSLIGDIPDSLWLKNKNGDLLLDFGRYVSKKNLYEYPKLTGEFVVVNTERLPFEWSSYRDDIKFPIAYVKIRIEENDQ